MAAAVRESRASESHHRVSVSESPGARTPRMVNGAPLKRDMPGRLRWPVRMVAGMGRVVWGTDADAVALAVCAVDQAAALRTASRKLARRAARAARDVEALSRGIERLVLAEPAARMAGAERYASWRNTATRAAERMSDAVAARDEWERRERVVSASYHVHRRWVVLAGDGIDASPTDAAYVWATQDTDVRISVRLRDARGLLGMTDEVANILAEIELAKIEGKSTK